MKKYILISLAALAALVLSCTPEPTLSVSPGSIPVGADAGSNSISVSANNAWSAKSSEAWIHISNSSGEAGDGRVSFTYDANPSSDERSATITITSSTLSQTVTVTQAQCDKLILAASDQHFGPEGGTFSVKVQANVTYSVEIVGGGKWIERTTTKGLTDYTETFTVAANETYDARSCEVVFNGAGQKLTVKVDQDQLGAMILDGDGECRLNWKNNTFNVSLKSNIGCKAVIVSGEAWLSQMDTKGLEEYEFQFEVSENAGKSSREGLIEFRTYEGKTAASVKVVQAPTPYIKLSAESLSFEKEGGSASLTIDSNADFTVSIPSDAAWLTAVPGEAKAYVFTAAENTGNATRSTTVRIVSDDDADIFAEVVVVQRGPSQTLGFTFTGQNLTLPVIYGADVTGTTSWGDNSGNKTYPAVMTKKYQKPGTYQVSIVFYGGIGVKFSGVTGIDEIDLSSF